MQRSTLAACLATLGAFVLAAPAQALNARSYVSVLGNDSAACNSPPTACRTLQGAHDKTAPGGEIDILDPGGYGPVTITKAISIVNDGVGVVGLVSTVGGAGITINAGASDAISLSGITIDGQGGANTNGIVFNSGGSLTIQDCVVRRNAGNTATTGAGLRFKPNGAGKLAISDSVFESNTASGINIAPSGSGEVRAALIRVEANSNTHGVIVDSTSKTGGMVKASMFDGVAANNSGTGVAAQSSQSVGGPGAHITLMQSVVANNGFGLFTSGQAVLRIGQSMVTDNGTGWLANFGGSLSSYGTNQVDGNAAADTITSKIPLD